MNLRRPIAFAVMALLTIATLLIARPVLSGEAPAGKEVVVRGLVRDIACPVQNNKSRSRNFNKQCAIDCVKRGSPVGILTDDGSMYLVISDLMPDVPQNEKLMPFVGKYVEARGIAFERKGQRAIVIKEMKEDKTVKLIEFSE